MNVSWQPSARSVSPAVCIAALAVSVSGHAEQKPLWEAGLGLGSVTFPDYRGSDTTHTYVLPFPYFVYRGEFLKADRDGARARFFDSDRVRLNVTMSASPPPVDSNDNPARRGMPDLNPTVDIGPSLDLTLWRSGDRRAKLDFRLPLVTGVTIEHSPQSTGFQFSPRLNLDLQDPAGLSGWNLGLVAGPLFGDRKQHQFYSVAQEFATPERPAYEARGGYAGAQFLAAISKRFPSFWVGGFVRYDTLSGAVFNDSPLVKRSNYLAGGVAIAWVFGDSSRMVEVTE